MASYHCTVKSDSSRSGSAHSDYINREGKYAAIENDRDKYQKYEDLVYKDSGNMPEWAKEDPREFWKAADEFERANGRSYTEIEIALPNELTREQQIELVEELIKDQLGENHAYSYAIHDKPATLSPDKKNTHAHIMFSERKLDGIERDRQQYFKRGNSKHSERGGNMKDPDWNRRDKVKEVRREWAALENKHLERHGHEARVDHRNLEDQKISAIERGDIEKAIELNREPERHLGPKIAQQTVREVKNEMAQGETKEKRIELRDEYYQKETTNRKAELASLARNYRKDSVKLANEKKAEEFEKIQKRLPIKTITRETAEKYAQQAYWKKIEKELIKDETKLDKDKTNYEKVKRAVDIRYRDCNGEYDPKVAKEMNRVAKWGEEVRRKESEVDRRRKDFDHKTRPADYEEKINKTTENILKRDAERVEELCELAEKLEPGKKLTTQDLKYMVDLSIKTQQPIRDQLEKAKAESEKKVIKPETAQAVAISVYTKGENKRLNEERKAIIAERERPGKSQEEQIALRTRTDDYNKRAAALKEKSHSPEGAAKIKEITERIEKRNEPIREQLAKVNEQLKPINKELSELKGLSQKIQQTARDQKIEQKVQGIKLSKLTPRTITRNAEGIDNFLQNRGAAHAPKGHTQAQIADDDLPKRKGPEQSL